VSSRLPMAVDTRRESLLTTAMSKSALEGGGTELTGFAKVSVRGRTRLRSPQYFLML